MPAPLFHVGATAICAHGGQITTVSSNTRVLVGGTPVATVADTGTVAGCAFTVPPVGPQPCVKVQWLVPAARVLVGGQPALLRSSSGLCQSAAMVPQGPPSIVSTQPRTTGT